MGFFVIVTQTSQTMGTMRYPSLLVLNICWAIVSLMLAIGVSQPMFTFTHFYFFDDTFSLYSGIFHLLAQGELILFGLLFGFSLLMPTLKMLMLLYTINAKSMLNDAQQRYLNRIGLIGKWSMLDVFVIAIMAVTIKLSMVAQVTIHYGLIVFSIGVVASMVLPHLISPQTIKQATTSITLLPTQLDDLIAKGQITLVQEEEQLALARLIDVYDQSKQWQAKAQTHINVNHHTELTLIAVRQGYNPSISIT